IMSGDQTENAFDELAPIYSLADWWKLLIYKKHPHGDIWHPASLARANIIVRKLLALRKLNMSHIIMKNLIKFKRKLLEKVAIKTT
ncbi:MAG: hypothetical protein ICV78_03425, partial [Tolypothrix sp. Co-bin9]|nr:hypothetical protein [Tolypothrix sp. Co-bin9]